MSSSNAPSLLTRGTIALVAVVQIVLGILFTFRPGLFPAMLGLPSAPAWTDWMFAMLGARAFGFAFGMIVALGDLRRHASWLSAMILVQAVDWIATITSVLAGKLTIAQVSTASFLPIAFIGVIAAELIRQRKSAALVEDK